MVVKSPNGKFLQRYIPARVIFVLLGFFGFNLVYAFKVVLSMSIIAMTNKTIETNHANVNITDGQCYDSGSAEESILPGVKLDWNSAEKSRVLGKNVICVLFVKYFHLEYFFARILFLWIHCHTNSSRYGLQCNLHYNKT